jgi:hypothetical protein
LQGIFSKGKEFFSDAEREKDAGKQKEKRKEIIYLW